MKIAVMPGDGVGKEVVPEGLKVLKEAGRKFGFSYSTTDYPFGGEYYLEKKITLPDSALKELAAHDAILFGAVGVDPRGSAPTAPKRIASCAASSFSAESGSVILVLR